MPKRFLKRYFPDFHTLRTRWEIRWLGRLLENPYLLHFNRRSVAGGVACGLFVAFIPLPVQMPLAAVLAVLLRANLLLAVALVWITNPLTMPAIFYFTYVVGTWIIGSPVAAHAGFEPSLHWFWEQFERIWKPLMVGSLSIGFVFALAGYGAVHLLWRLHIIRQLRVRRNRRATRPHSAIENRQN
ncbi:DUF2062 domain-containing protein [Nitrococcus mobilis]|uniref:DUF2062 domain-containing protein n=1 Tax=Nitrococcus mobilis Nb-231 TaxID=314278 RepID=A4BMK4_9GAMM|nr:DUF2062 domain-containing protein [Nitrococcus mobilis]EAR23542.1 hypothetical protein NB231_17018 [Nitrococcus mobilis Nb-231]